MAGNIKVADVARIIFESIRSDFTVIETYEVKQPDWIGVHGEKTATILVLQLPDSQGEVSVSLSSAGHLSAFCGSRIPQSGYQDHEREEIEGLLFGAIFGSTRPHFSVVGSSDGSHSSWSQNRGYHHRDQVRLELSGYKIVRSDHYIVELLPLIGYVAHQLHALMKSDEVEFTEFYSLELNSQGGSEVTLN